jgi:hypothetical protein
MKRKTTVSIEVSVLMSARKEAARRGCSFSELVEAALRPLLRPRRRSAKLPPLPTFRSGGALVDVAGRDALYDVMEGR